MKKDWLFTEYMLCLFTCRKVLDERDKIYSQLADYLQVKNVIEHIKVSHI